MERNDELLHYGVKGMKWGVIRSRAKMMNKAYRQSISDDKARSKSGERVTIRQANINAKKAAVAAGKNFKAEQKNNSANAQSEKKPIQEIRDNKGYGKKVATKILDKAKDEIATKWTERNTANKEKIREKIKEELFGRKLKQPWDEKPSNKQPWDEKPKKTNTGNI